MVRGGLVPRIVHEAVAQATAASASAPACHSAYLLPAEWLQRFAKMQIAMIFFAMLRARSLLTGLLWPVQDREMGEATTRTRGSRARRAHRWLRLGAFRQRRR